MLLSIIIVSFNTAQLTLATLKSVVDNLKSDKVKNTSLISQSEIIVVDNASSDDSVTQIKKFIKRQQSTTNSSNSSKSSNFFKQSNSSNLNTLKIELIENKNNVGFAQANNLAIAKSLGKYIFLLNSDTIVQPKAISNLLNTFLNNPSDPTTAFVSSHSGKLDNLGILAASLQNPDGTPQPQGGDLPNLFSLASHLLFFDDLPLIGHLLSSTQHTGKNILPSKSALDQKGWVAATAVMVKKELIDQIGELDSNIFMYGEDIEWCLRAKDHHWDVAIDNTAKITHYGSASSHSSKAVLGELHSYEYIWAKHKPQWQRPYLKLLLKLGCRLRVLLFGILLNQKQRAKPYRFYLNHELPHTQQSIN
jgi:GT2 family glycosyltransferase